MFKKICLLSLVFTLLSGITIPLIPEADASSPHYLQQQQRQAAQRAADQARQNAQRAAERQRLEAQRAAERAKQEAQKSADQHKKQVLNTQKNLAPQRPQDNTKNQHQTHQALQKQRALDSASPKKAQTQQQIDAQKHTAIQDRLNRLKRDKELKDQNIKRKQQADKEKKAANNSALLLQKSDLTTAAKQPQKPEAASGESGGRNNNGGATSAVGGSGKKGGGNGSDGNGNENKRIQALKAEESAALNNIKRNQATDSTKVLNAKINEKTSEVTKKTPSGGSPILKGDPYHPDSVAARQKEWQKTYGGFNSKFVAAELGYGKRISPQNAPFNSHGQPVFSNGKGYITPDVDEHNTNNGWKMFDRKGRRTGTWNFDLSKRIKD